MTFSESINKDEDESVNENDVANERESVKIQIDFSSCIENDVDEKPNRNNNFMIMNRSKSEIY